jgi:hypothetical protein
MGRIQEMSPLFLANRLEQIVTGQTAWVSLLASNINTINLILPILKRVLESMIVLEPAQPAPNTSPMYYVPEGATGVFKGYDRMIALYDLTSEKWLFFIPYEGYQFYNKEDKNLYVFRFRNETLSPCRV